MPAAWVGAEGLRLVGRDAEVRRLTAQLDAVAAGASRVVLVSGESGIGKSGLATAVLNAGTGRGFVGLAGRAHPLYAGLAYAPLVEALGPQLSGIDAHAWARLLGGLPAAAELGRLFPGLPGPPQPLGDASLEKMRLFEAVSALLGRIAAHAPVTLLLDDLHWADPGTVELAHYLCHAVPGRRLLMLMTWRGAGPAGPLGALVTSLRRDGRCLELRLGPVPDEAVAELIADMLAGDPPMGLVEAVTARAGGVPLFVTALVRHLIEAGRLSRGAAGWAIDRGALTVLPAIVRDVVLGRLANLDAGDREVFELVAVAGAAATADVLQAVRDAAVDQPLRRLLAEGLATERLVGPDVVYGVAHPLYAEVAYAELTELQRRRTHAALAAAVDRLRPDDVVALAPHYRGAGDLVDPHRQMDVLAAAGERALAVHADNEAVGFLGDAVDRARALARTELLPGLLEQLGSAQERCGEIDDAVTSWREALTGGDSLMVGRLHNRLALLECERGDLDSAEAHLQHVLATHPDMDGVIEQHCLRLIVIGRSQQFEVSRDAVAHVEALARQYPSDVAQGVTHLARSFLALFDRDYTTARAEGDHALTHLQRSGSSFLVGGPHRQVAHAALAAGDLAAARTHAALGVRLAHLHGVPTIECGLRINLAVAEFLAGEWDHARAVLDEAAALGRRAMAARALAAVLGWRALLHSYRGELEAARDCLATAERGYPAVIDQHLAGDLGVLRATVDRMAGIVGTPLPVAVPVIGARYPVTAALLGDARLAAGDREGAITLIREMRDCRGSRLLPAFADRLEGVLNSDAALLAAAQQAFEALGMPFEAARVVLERAELVGDVQAVPAALAVVGRLGAKPWIDRGRRLLRAHGIRPVVVRPVGGELTPRELEVAQLAAVGLSNAEIASRLFLSVRTVETHLRRVYARLGLNSRVALARWIGGSTRT